MRDLIDKIADHVLQLALQGDDEAGALVFTAFCAALLRTDIPELQFDFDGEGYMVPWFPGFRSMLAEHVAEFAP